MAPIKIALAHDYLNSWGGGERVLNIFKELYPQADVVAITYDSAKVTGHVNYPVRTSFIQRIPFGHKFHKYFLALMPWAVASLDFTGYDLVLSDSSGFIKGITVPKNCLHVCYIHTATRYLTVDEWYFKQTAPKFAHPVMPLLIKYLKKKDLEGAAKPDLYIANSQETAKRVKKFYHRDVEAVIFPPADTKQFYATPEDKVEDYYLVACRLASYKRVDLAIEVCNKLGKRLVVIGTGPEEDALKELAGPTVEFRGKVSDEELRQAFARCKAFLFPPLEDAGMTPLECMACGRPVLAYGKGGALESVRDGVSGLFFEDQSVDALCDAINQSEKIAWNSKEIMTHAAQFSAENFKKRVKAVVDAALEKR